MTHSPDAPAGGLEAERTSTRPRPGAGEDRDQAGARLLLAGAPLHNDNRGVEALGRSVVDHLAQSVPGRVSVLDDGWGVRPSESQPGYRGEVELLGARYSRRWYRRESWARVSFDQRLGGLGNPVADRLGAADAVLDLSGGDSFTDLYGPHRLATVSAPKEAALRSGRPLVLLPQTFGPFTTVAARRQAERIVRASALAYSRDAWSHDQLLTLAGPDADRSLVREGVDVAFGLVPREPDPRIVEQFQRLDDELVVGVNISGLLRTAADWQRFGLAGDYLRTMTDLVRSLIAAGAFVVLVSHVHGDGVDESDATSIRVVREALSATERDRVWSLPAHLRAPELKWCIARTAWFAGSRMHATIAALGSAVPAFGYAYSDKTAGVFGTCGVSDHVADAREVAGPEAVERAMASFTTRERAGMVLAENVPAVAARARAQLDDVLDAVTTWRHSPGPRSVIA
ncbi:polysaccharide pyruvyl transferase family protein [Georgenia sunbinii]|uniref:polysaccharide pyruvyl transferase family protein n=1 Tax=Georgenia sunbinii TaxID=3117728 RepID=UPI002F266A34